MKSRQRLRNSGDDLGGLPGIFLSLQVLVSSPHTQRLMKPIYFVPGIGWHSPDLREVNLSHLSTYRGQMFILFQPAETRSMILSWRNTIFWWRTSQRMTWSQERRSWRMCTSGKRRPWWSLPINQSSRSLLNWIMLRFSFQDWWVLK